MSDQPQIQLHKIYKQFRLYNSDTSKLLHTLFPFRKSKYKNFTALSNINIEVNKGEIVGIIGRNGSGKSTLLKVIAGITAPSSGTVQTRGTIVPLLELGGGFHAELTGRENLRYFTIMQDFDKNKTSGIIQQAIEFADIGHFIDQPIRTYSKGMRSRLAFSISIFLNADILLLDEVLAVGDVYFKEKSYEKMLEMLKSGKTIIMVSHSFKEVTKTCSRAILLEKGEIVMDGKPDDVMQLYGRSLKHEQNKDFQKNIKGTRDLQSNN